MKIGKTVAFGKLASAGRRYGTESLYPINRIYFVHSGKARFRDENRDTEFVEDEIITRAIYMMTDRMNEKLLSPT